MGNGLFDGYRWGRMWDMWSIIVVRICTPSPRTNQKTLSSQTKKEPPAIPTKVPTQLNPPQLLSLKFFIDNRPPRIPSSNSTVNTRTNQPRLLENSRHVTPSPLLSNGSVAFAQYEQILCIKE